MTDSGGERGRDTARGQVFTLEAFVAAVLLLAALLVALTAPAVTPLSSSTANQHVETQLSGVATGTLDGAAANGSLRPALLYWNRTGDRFHGASGDGYYQTGGPPTRFGAQLNQTLGGRNLAFNVRLRYATPDGGAEVRRMVYQGRPTAVGVRATETITLYDDDVLHAANGTSTNATLGGTAGFYAPDASPDDDLYNVVRVEVVAWRS